MHYIKKNEKAIRSSVVLSFCGSECYKLKFCGSVEVGECCTEQGNCQDRIYIKHRHFKIALKICRFLGFVGVEGT